MWQKLTSVPMGCLPSRSASVSSEPLNKNNNKNKNNNDNKTQDTSNKKPVATNGQVPANPKPDETQTSSKERIGDQSNSASRSSMKKHNQTSSTTATGDKPTTGSRKGSRLKVQPEQTPPQRSVGGIQNRKSGEVGLEDNDELDIDQLGEEEEDDENDNEEDELEEDEEEEDDVDEDDDDDDDEIRDMNRAAMGQGARHKRNKGRGGAGADGAGSRAGSNANARALNGADPEPTLDADLLQRYVAIDYEIQTLEDRDALRVYHDKIELLEQLERELDMITVEAEEIASRAAETNSANISQSRSAANSAHDGQRSVSPNQSNNNKNNKNNNNNNNNNTSSSNVNNNNTNNNNSKSNNNNNNADMKIDSEPNSLSSTPTSTINRGRSDESAGADPKSQQFGRGSLTPVHRSFFGRRSRAVADRDTAGPSQTLQTPAGYNQPGQQQQQQAGSEARHGQQAQQLQQFQYSTVEEVFNRKIMLERERDKLKKEVETVILECDKLQQKYKKRDEILDRLFDGRTGNGLENHLEQQLNWLLEQKHYVDQVFYAWKRAETLTSQTCEQFSSALELLKQFSKLTDTEERLELAKNIEQLLVKSRKDMEQAQKYNPNVDAPFFTDNETERFDKIIETISSPSSINPGDYSQILAVIQFAYKRAVSIRLWLEQILQTTIARDSFELAEEYKWIAIQLRKERINLIKAKLQESPYKAMAAAVLEQTIRQQQSSSAQALAQLAEGHRNSMTPQNQNQNKNQQQQQQQQGQQAHQSQPRSQPSTGAPRSELNRDSGVESEPNDMDIEEEIYRLLELNKSRLESNGAAGNLQQQQQTQSRLKVNNQNQLVNQEPAASRDQMMRDRVERRVKGAEPSAAVLSGGPSLTTSRLEMEAAGPDRLEGSAGSTSSAYNTSSAASTRLKVELDEEARQRLFKQVDQVHSRHKSRIERLRGSNRNRATTSIMARLQLENPPRKPSGGEPADKAGLIQTPAV